MKSWKFEPGTRLSEKNIYVSGMRRKAQKFLGFKEEEWSKIHLKETQNNFWMVRFWGGGGAEPPQHFGWGGLQPPQPATPMMWRVRYVTAHQICASMSVAHRVGAVVMQRADVRRRLQVRGAGVLFDEQGFGEGAGLDGGGSAVHHRRVERASRRRPVPMLSSQVHLHCDVSVWVVQWRHT